MLERKQASRKSPAVTVRFRSKQELAKIRRAAKMEGLSVNTFVAGRAAVAAEELIIAETRKANGVEFTEVSL